ncbi:MAG: hypothetical protein IKX56_00230 [Muribaculaceae bacterium]|nr:hypothetical protein [Muribaculaceae bacterium]
MPDRSAGKKHIFRLFLAIVIGNAKKSRKILFIEIADYQYIVKIIEKFFKKSCENILPVRVTVVILQRFCGSQDVKLRERIF